MTAAYIIWKEEYCVGRPDLDAHHQRMLGIINDLYRVMIDGEWETKTGPLQKRLASHAQSHFALEEAAMRAVNFSALEAHIQAHQLYLQRLDEILSQPPPNAEPNPAPRQLLQFLKEWWLGHIVRMDKAYAPYLAQSTPL